LTISFLDQFCCLLRDSTFTLASMITT